MVEDTIVLFTGWSTETMELQGGIHAWSLDPNRARKCTYVVCAQNRNAGDQFDGRADHRAGFVIGKVEDVVRSDADKTRYAVECSEIADLNLADVWPEGRRNPVYYSSLEDMGINPDELAWRKPAESDPDYFNKAKPSKTRPLTLQQAKQGLAAGLSISEDQIEIIIRG